jgi:hypothetical protein
MRKINDPDYFRKHLESRKRNHDPYGNSKDIELKDVHPNERKVEKLPLSIVDFKTLSHRKSFS